MDTTKILHSRRDAAQLISVSVPEIDKLIASGQLVAIRIGRRVLVARTALERFARKGTPATGGGTDPHRNSDPTRTAAPARRLFIPWQRDPRTGLWWRPWPEGLD
jgi:excisionase family DNA binding protein